MRLVAFISSKGFNCRVEWIDSLIRLSFLFFPFWHCWFLMLTQLEQDFLFHFYLVCLIFFCYVLAFGCIWFVRFKNSIVQVHLVAGCIVKVKTFWFVFILKHWHEWYLMYLMVPWWAVQIDWLVPHGTMMYIYKNWMWFLVKYIGYHNVKILYFFYFIPHVRYYSVY